MATTLERVDFDPFADKPANSGVSLERVDFDPFADKYQQAAEKVFAQQKNLGLVGGRADSLANRFMKGATLGLGDEILAGLETPMEMVRHGVGPSEGYKYAKAFQNVKGDQAKQQMGAYGSAAEIAGSLMPTSAIMKGVGAAGNAATALPLIGRVAASPFARSATGGALSGAVEAYGDDKDVGQGAALGAAGGAAGDAVARSVGYGVRKLFDRRPEIPSTQGLFDAGTNAYKRFDASNGVVTQQGIDDLSKRLADTMQKPKFAFDPVAHPNVAASYNAINKYLSPRSVPDSMASLEGVLAPEAVQLIRQHAANAAETAANKGQARVGQKFKNTVDDWINSLADNPAGRVAGDLDVGSLAEGNRLWARASKAERLDDFITKARRSAAVTGRSEETALRRAADKLLNKPRGLTADEKDAANAVVNGTPVQNLARSASDYIGFHSPWALLGHAAAFPTTGGASLPIGAAAEAAKWASKNATKRRLDDLSRVIRSGGNAAALKPVPSKLTGLLDANKDLVTSATLAGLLGSF